MSDTPRIAELLEEDAEVLRVSHTLDGKWFFWDEGDKSSKNEHDERLRVAAEPRGIAG